MRLGLFLAASLTVAAATPLARADVPEAIRNANSEVALSIVGRHLSYSEANDGIAPGAPDPLDRETGWLPGVRLDAGIQRPMLGVPDVLLAARFAHIQGSVTYDGLVEQLSPNAPPTYTPITLTSDATFDEAGALVGVGFPLGENGAITPLLRYGFRAWRRTVGSGAASAYGEAYTHHELAVGGRFQVTPVDRLVLSIEGSLGTTIAPHQSSDIVSPSLEFALGASLVGTAGAWLDYAASRHWHLRVGWEMHAFGYGKSAAVQLPPPNERFTATEPGSSTTEHDLRGGVAYSF